MIAACNSLAAQQSYWLQPERAGWERVASLNTNGMVLFAVVVSGRTPRVAAANRASAPSVASRTF